MLFFQQIAPYLPLQLSVALFLVELRWPVAHFIFSLYSTKAEEGLRTSDFRLPTSDLRLPTSDFPTPVAIKGGGRPTRLLPYVKMLLVSITFFPSAG